MNKQSTIITLLSFIIALSPAVTFATSTSFEVSGWLPYWRSATSTTDALNHIDAFSEVDPFVYTVKSDGTLKDNGGLDSDPWKSFITTAQAKKIRVIPTIMWSDADAMHRTFSNTKLRQAFATNIAQVVKDNNFDGIDIDFEGKHAEDKKYFSTFLKGLYQRMGDKMVMCTIEARTPISAKYYGTDVPPDADQYANDYVAINKYCDRVRIMAYDQQGIDLQLSDKAASSSELYAPVGDPAWIEKVITLTLKDINKRKISIGVPTYGYEYDVTAYANNQYIYDILWTFNPGYAKQIESQYSVTPSRNSAGELFLTYKPVDSTSTMSVSSIMSMAQTASAAASQYATTYNSHLNFRMLEWPDGESLRQKIALAHKYGLRGVSLFKIDGGEDPTIWDALVGVKQQ